MNPGSQRGVRLAAGILGLLGLVGLGGALLILKLPPVIVLALTVAGIIVPILVLRPEVGLHLLIPLILVENYGEANQQITISKVAGILILGSWFLSIAVTRVVKLRVNALIIALAAFAGWTGLSILGAQDSQIALSTTLTYCQLIVAMLMFGSVLDSAEAVTRVLRSIVYWTTAAGAHGLALYAAGLVQTSAGVVLNRNQMATYLTFAIVCALLLYQASRSGLERIAIIATLPILFVALALTFSRTGVIAMFVLLGLLAYRLAKKHGFMILGTSLALLLVISVGLPNTFYERIESIAPTVRKQADTFGMRLELAKAGLRMVSDHPILGVGAGNFGLLVNRYGRSGFLMRGRWATHNTFIGIAAESGIPAALFFGLAIAAAIVSTRASARRAGTLHPTLELQAIAVEMSILAIMISSLSGDEESSKFLYIFLGLVLALDRITRRLPQDASLHVIRPAIVAVEATQAIAR